MRDDPAFEFRTNTFCINPQRKCSEGRQNMSGLVLAFWRLCLEYARQGVWLPSYFTLNDFFFVSLFRVGWSGGYRCWYKSNFVCFFLVIDRPALCCSQLFWRIIWRNIIAISLYFVYLLFFFCLVPFHISSFLRYMVTIFIYH